MAIKAFTTSEIIAVYTAVSLPNPATQGQTNLGTSNLYTHIMGQPYSLEMAFGMAFLHLEAASNGSKIVGAATKETIKKRTQNVVEDSPDARLENLFPGIATQAFSATKAQSVDLAKQKVENDIQGVAECLRQQFPWLSDVVLPMTEADHKRPRAEKAKVLLDWMHALEEKYGHTHGVLPESEWRAQAPKTRKPGLA